MNEKEQRRIKVRKVREALKRLRRTRAAVSPPDQRASWFARLKNRLGLTGSGDRSEE